jgi:diguanylate cyclase (GGDEF)-like protein
MVGILASTRDRRERTPRSVRAHLVILVAVAMLTVAAGSAYSYVWSLQQAEEAAVDRMTYQAERAATAVAESISTATDLVTSLAAQPGLAAAFAGVAEGCTLQLAGSGAFPDQRLDLVRPDGVVTCSSGPLAETGDPAVHAGEAWLTQGLAAASARVSEDGVDGRTRGRAIAVTAPVRSTSGDEAVGVVAVLMRYDGAAPSMTRAFGGTPSVRFTLLDAEDRQVLSSDPRIAAEGAVHPLQGAGTSGTADISDGETLVYGSAAVPDANWRVIAGLPHDEVFDAARGSLLRQLSLGLLALLVLIGGAWLLNRRVARPLELVISAADSASRNRHAPRVDETGTAETVQLARSFNTMLDIRSGHEAQLAYQADHDTLTGLPNRSALILQLDQALADGRCVAVLCLGLDRFRNVNDAVGHHLGDRLLQDVAARLTGALRPGETLARFANDEFVVVCEDVENVEPSSISTRIQAALEAPFTATIGSIVLSATAGIATGSGPETSSSQLLREADSAMRAAKIHGVTYRVYDQDMQTRATAHLSLQQDLALALERDELVVHYQPLINLRSGAIVGAEALVRWLHPERGLIPPGDFIPIAEQTGQIEALGDFVLQQACEQAVRWSVAGHGLTMSVNVAAAQLRSGTFVDTVTRVLAATGLPHSQLCLEITESSLMTANTALLDDLAELRSAGVHLALDDFGTGYSSLSYLQQLPCDELKIDRSFVSRLADDNREMHLVAAIVAMARALGLTVVAEGIETDEQQRMLTALGCHQAQGFLFSRPVPEAEFRALLDAGRFASARRMRIA